MNSLGTFLIKRITNLFVFLPHLDMFFVAYSLVYNLQLSRAITMPIGTIELCWNLLKLDTNL